MMSKLLYRTISIGTFGALQYGYHINKKTLTIDKNVTIEKWYMCIILAILLCCNNNTDIIKRKKVV